MNVMPSFTEEEIKTLIYLLEKSNGITDEIKIKKDILIDKINAAIKYPGILSSYKIKGYHLTDIPKGKYGQLSKVIEEALELKDAMEQGQKIMCLVELSDILGAIEGYLEKHYGDKVTVSDLFNMSNATKRAFDSGQRK